MSRVLTDSKISLKIKVGQGIISGRMGRNSHPNSKSEALNTKQIRNPNFQMFKTVFTDRAGFGHLNFENLKIVSDFDIRISDLSKFCHGDEPRIQEV